MKKVVVKTEKPIKGEKLTLAHKHWFAGDRGTACVVLSTRRDQQCKSGLRIEAESTLNRGVFIKVDATWFAEYAEDFSYKAAA